MMPDDFTPEQKERLSAATSIEELKQIAEEEGLELSDEAIESMGASGGDFQPLLDGRCSPYCDALVFSS